MEITQALRGRIRECNVQALAFRLWLSALTPVNFILMGGAAVLSLVGGSSILLESQVIEAKTAAIMAVTGGAMTLLHNALKCDPHQAECRRLHSAYQGLGKRYETLLTESDDRKQRERLAALDDHRAALDEGATASYALWCLGRAQARIGKECSK